MASMMKYVGAINILRSDRILPRAWRLEIADMLETINNRNQIMEKHHEISALDNRSLVSDPAGSDIRSRTDSRSGDTGTGDGAGDSVAAVRDDGHSAGRASQDGLNHDQPDGAVREALCCSSISPCEYQRTHRTGVCETCQKAAAIDRIDVKAEAKEAEADEEKELFAAVTKIDLAGAVKHLRNWAAYKANEHCQEYANLIEAQARLIAWFVKERTSNNTSGDVKAEAKSQEPDGEVREALNTFLKCAYPVSKVINPRGYNWSEAYLDQAKPIAEAALHLPKIAAAETSPGDVVAVLRKCRDYIASDLRMSRDEDEKARRDNLIEEATAAANRIDVKAEAKSQEPEAVKPDHRIYFACECCENYAPENGVSPVDDIAVMPDGTWLCSGCYADCEKSAYGLVASDVTDFEYPDFDELPKPKLYTHPTTKPEAPAVSVEAETIGAAARIIDPDAFKKYLYDAMLTSRRDRALTKATAIAALISGGR